MATAKPKEVDKTKSEVVEGEEVAPKKSKKMLFIIIGILVLLLGGGAAYYFLVLSKKPVDPNAPVEVKVEEAKEPIYVVFDPFTVNLRGGGQYLQTTITIETRDEKDGTKIKTYLPLVRSKILLILSNKTSEEIMDEAGKKQLVEDIKEIFKPPLATGVQVSKPPEILFTSFVIQ